MALSSRALHGLAETASRGWVAGVVAVLFAAWVAVGAVTGFPSAWQVALNTAGWGVALILLFVIQHVQHKHTLAVQLKLDELLDAVEGANERLIGSERLDSAELSRLREERPRQRP